MPTPMLMQPTPSSRRSPARLLPFGDSETTADSDHVRPRVDAPPFRYRGLAEPHWRGQGCYPAELEATQADQRVVIMACGCRASVPWWTLEQIR